MRTLALSLFVGLFVVSAFPQRLVSPVVGNYRVSDADLIAIVRAEDARNAEPVIAMFTNVNTAVRYRAALAAGRIGDEKAIDGLSKLLKDNSPEVGTMAAFAIGEVESINGADAILAELAKATVGKGMARLVEAAGKIAAANPKNERSKKLGAAIINVLKLQTPDNFEQDEQTVLLGLTAVLRARPDGAEDLVARFLDSTRSRIVADAANTLARLRTKKANDRLIRVLKTDPDAAARANAARALGAAEDNDALDLLLDAAIKDADSRVRVSAIRAVGSLKDTKAIDKLIERGWTLLKQGDTTPTKISRPAERNELYEIASVLGRLLPNTDHKGATEFLIRLDRTTGYGVPEIKIALAQVSPKGFFDSYAALNKDVTPEYFPSNWHIASALSQAFAELTKLPKDSEFRARAQGEVSKLLAAYYRINELTWEDAQTPENKEFITRNHGRIFHGDHTRYADGYLPLPDILTAFAAFKPEGLNEILLNHLKLDEVLARATAAGLLADQPATKENVEALNAAFFPALVTDTRENDAELAILDALAKLDKKAGVGTFIVALSAPDYLVRKKAFEILADKDLQKEFPGLPATLASVRSHHKDQVLPYSPGIGTNLGQILNTTADYRRALSRRNDSVKAMLTTEKGTFTIVFNPEEAPLTVDNFVKLARSGYFNGLEVHRVVPNFVMQDGDPRGDGNGGPGWSIRCEVNMLSYDRGAVGMALSGKDTGGSQWFVTHSPQPHLDGGYTVFGHVSEVDMKVVDKIVRGDRVLTVKIIGR